MPTALATVKVTPLEARAGFLVTCDRCELRSVRGTRPAADRVALEHRAGHNQPDPRNQVADL